ncbi:alpha/beta hydrolase [Sphingomonas oleivorans]|uniref:alpha/beta hydrolase n=1 Tax=Sphingomonas oleivorans TaxID=1735121 RepID=UPI000D339629|nr:hydrolase [Sphingomonas oleivorans]
MTIDNGNEPDPPLSRYEIGRTAAIACQADQRFSYCLYVPPSLADAGRLAEARILVVIHGTERGNQAMRDLFVPLADRLGLIVMAPLFPAGIIDPYDRDNYKYVEYNGIRFDHLMLAMLDEIGARYGVPVERISMFGFSGGAHLAHRFLYLHPERLDALSVCSPGSPTLLDETRDWWVGVRDIEQRFGRPLDKAALRKVAVHLAVGDADTDTDEITHSEGSPLWMEGANDAGVTRVDRLLSLAASLRENGLGVQVDLLPGIRHERQALADSAIVFFESVLAVKPQMVADDA